MRISYRKNIVLKAFLVMVVASLILFVLSRNTLISSKTPLPEVFLYSFTTNDVTTLSSISNNSPLVKYEVTTRKPVKTYEPIDWFNLLLKADIHKFSRKRILLFDRFQWWNFSPNKSIECPPSHLVLRDYCEFTEDVNLIMNSSAVIIAQDMYHTKTVDESNLKNQDLKIVYFTLESPKTESIKISQKSFLASYWRGSDFWTPYYKWKQYAVNFPQEISPINYAKNKSKLVAIVVSNCITSNERMEYVKELQKFIAVDIYGRCGPDLPCPRNSEDCFQNISKLYKFYLAFENANCRDYITEKLFVNAFKWEILPIVVGPHRMDYQNLAPYNSFIHVEDFKSPEQLATYLHILNNNDNLYNQYFQWKTSGEIMPTYFFCQVCAMLQYSDYFPIKSRLHEGFTWDAHNQDLCMKNNEWYWDR